MDKKIVEAWDSNKAKVQAVFEAAHPDNYKDVIRAVVQMLHDASDEYEKPDPERIHEIDDGSYQGTLVYVIGATGYQPDEYWYVKVGYGSCSGCDTLQAICNYEDGKPSDEQVSEYMTLALHIIQGMRKMGRHDCDA